jgi:hypothetical protein
LDLCKSLPFLLDKTQPFDLSHKKTVGSSWKTLENISVSSYHENTHKPRMNPTMDKGFLFLSESRPAGCSLDLRGEDAAHTGPFSSAGVALSQP